jgi:tripartite-type tricarboxylate transporter receptor subunit TctC
MPAPRIPTVLRSTTVALLMASTLIAAAPGAAQDAAYPTKTIRIIVPLPPGSGGDAATRIVADKLRAELGQPVIVDNRPGAETTVGAEAAAQAAPDGYTLLMGHMSTTVLNPLIYSQLRYDPLKQFTPISRVADTSAVLVVNPDVPAKTLGEFVRYVKANPGKASYGSALTIIRLLGETLKAEQGLEIERISYRGGAAVMQDAAGKVIDMAIADISAAMPYIKSGRVRALATTGPTRNALLPDVPTAREAGFPEIELNGWWALYAPAKTPPEIVTKLNAAVRKALTSPDVVQRMTSSMGAVPVASTPEEVTSLIQQDAKRWAPVVQKLNMRQSTPD